MKSYFFLKPFQLATVMSYIENTYHSNDESFLRILSELLLVIKV